MTNLMNGVIDEVIGIIGLIFIWIVGGEIFSSIFENMVSGYLIISTMYLIVIVSDLYLFKGIGKKIE